MILQETKTLTFLFLWTVAAMLIVYFAYVTDYPETNRVYPMNCRNISCAVENSSHYLINTPSCTIPDFDPSLPSMAKFKVKKPKELVCFQKPPLTEEVGLNLIFHKERVPQYSSSSDSSLACSYQGITRAEQKPEKYNSNCDNIWTLGTKLPIEKRETIIKEDGILVTCEDQKTKKMVYKSVHFFIQPRRVEEKRKKFKVEFGDRINHREMLNIIIMGTDSVSRGNLRRNMPKTFDYLTNELNAIDFKGYNKVADNTDPNLMALLMGLTWAELNAHECIPKKIKTMYDHCPFLWKDFAEKGYATALGEDAPWMGVFHYRKAGFCREPTDFYNRPYFYASDKLTGNSAGNKGYAGNLCQAGRKSISVVHNYSLGIAEELKDIPYFGFYWTASITHNDLSAATKADKPSVEYLKRLKEGGYLENTILFFISDHGMRFGKFRTTYPGMLEERLPYLMMVFPDWFIEQYPKVMMNLWINTKRLTSPFDIHVTLQDILNQAFADPSKRFLQPSLKTITMKEKKSRTFLSVLAVGATFCVFSLYMMASPVRRRIYPVDCSNTSCSVEDSPHYLIHTPGCTIPDFDSSLPSLAKYKLSTPRKLECSQKLPLTEDSGLSLIFYKERIPEYTPSVYSVNCSYQSITRAEQDPKKYDGNCDRKWNIKEKIPLEKRHTSIEEDGILVTCDDREANKTIYKSVHFYVQPRRVEEKRSKFKAEFGDRNKHRNLLNVIIMGTDAVSRGNLRRHMPDTFEYLTNELNAIDLRGYNKVGDNTDPNLAAVLMGLGWDELQTHQCLPKKSKTRYDNCPLLWKDFAEKGYATAYGEDAPWMGVFHFNKVGFCKEPTDYYNRPYFYASDKLTGHGGGNGGYNGNLCQAGRKSISLIHNYSLSIAEELKDIPYFGFYWSASVTHDYLGSATMADKPCLEYLKRLKGGGYLENTVLFFLSDHGLRWGNFRSTYAGMLEERLPYVLMVFPDWFVMEYPKTMMNLWINTRRLTSPFDIHATLHDILNQAFADPSKGMPALPVHGQSLFHEVPVNRSCEDAGIPAHYCTCEHTNAADPSDPHLLAAAKEAVDEINYGLLQYPECVQLNISKVLNGRVGSANNSTIPKNKDTVATTYMVTFSTEPGDGILESTLKYHEGNYELSGEVSRVNQYGNQSHCITDQLYRKYCYCKDLMM